MYYGLVSHEVLSKRVVFVYIHGICSDAFFNYLDFFKYCKAKVLEVCAVQIVTADKRMTIICVYRSLSDDFNHFLRLLIMAFCL